MTSNFLCLTTYSPAASIASQRLIIMVAYNYDQKEHTYYDSYSGVHIYSDADFERFWLNFYETIQKHHTLLLDCLEMEIEDYESMRMEYISGAWSNKPFLEQSLTEENVKRLRELRSFVEKKSPMVRRFIKCLRATTRQTYIFVKTKVLKKNSKLLAVRL